MIIRLIEKIENLSLIKQFWALFFIATFDAWIMPLVTIFLYVTGLHQLDLFQAGYAEFLWNSTGIDFPANLITEPQYYAIYIYLLTGSLDALYVPGWGKPVVILNIFHILSFVIFITLLVRCNLSKSKQTLYSLIGVAAYYGIGFVTAFIYIIFIIAIGTFFA